MKVFKNLKVGHEFDFIKYCGKEKKTQLPEGYA